MRAGLVLLALAAVAGGCADSIRIGVAAGRVICGALGCPCASSGGRVVGFDVFPDGGVRVIHAEPSP